MSDPNVDPDAVDGGSELTLRGQLKATVRKLNEHPTRDGADVDQVVAAAADETGRPEGEVRDELTQLLLDGEVYPPTEGRVRVTPP